MPLAFGSKSCPLRPIKFFKPYGRKIKDDRLRQGDPHVKKTDAIPAFLWLMIGATVMIVSYQMSLGTLHTPGPGLMPFLLGSLLCIVSLPIFMGSLLRRTKTAGAPGAPGIWQEVEPKNVLILLISMIGYALLLEKLGFLLTAFLFLFILFATFDSRRWFFAFAASFLTILFTYLLFVVALKVELPHGIVGIG
jgi:putative tricarboxylic transport membrane protein